MNDRITPDDLAAFADGELEGVDLERVLESLADTPHLARQALGQRKLKQAVCGCMQSESPTAPADLRQRIVALAMQIDPVDSAATPQMSDPKLTEKSHPPLPALTSSPSAPAHPVIPPAKAQASTELFGDGHDERGSVLGFIARWSPALIAAILLLAAMVIHYAPTNTADFDREHMVAYPGVLPVSQVNGFMRRHVQCGDQLAELRELAQFPTAIEQVPQSIESIVGCKPYPTLDLSAMGYTFWKAGECGLPGQKSVHLIYRAKPETNRNDSLSLWMVRDEGQLHIDEGKPYCATPDTACHSLLVWRDGGMIYYLVGDKKPLVTNVVAQLATRK